MQNMVNLIVKTSIFMGISILIASLQFPVPSIINVQAQSGQSSITGQDTDLLNISDAIYTANNSKFLGSKNMSLSPHLITEERYFENGLLNGVVNVTNNQTFINTYLSDGLLVGKGNGTFETVDGQKITWISSDLGRQTDDQWVFYGIMLFNNTGSDALSVLNNSLALSKSTSGLNQPEYIWLLE